MTALVLAVTCPPWCDSTCRDEDDKDWQQFHTHPDLRVPAGNAGYDTVVPVNVLLSLVRRDSITGTGTTQISLGTTGGFDDIRLDLRRARELAAQLNRLADLGEAS